MAETIPLFLNEVEKLREDTPGVQNVVHLNNAGASLPPVAVTKAMLAYLEEEASFGPYETQRKHADEITAVYNSVASLINAHPFEIAMMPSSTVAMQQALGCVPFTAGDRVLCSMVEYHANYIPLLQIAKRAGVTVEVVPDEPSGGISVSALEKAIQASGKPPVRLIVLTHVPSHSGVVNPAAAVGAVARKHNILYFLDACQSVGQMPVDVQEIQCDVLTASARKFLRGPRAVGFLYVSSSALSRLNEPQFLDGKGADWVSRDSYQVLPDARRFETWEQNVAAVIGLGVAAKYALSVGVGRAWARVQTLAGMLRQELRKVPGLTVHDRGSVQCGIVSFTVEGFPPPLVQSFLAAHGINVNVNRPATALMDMGGLRSGGVVRASPHYYNTESEVLVVAQKLSEWISAGGPAPASHPPQRPREPVLTAVGPAPPLPEFYSAPRPSGATNSLVVAGQPPRDPPGEPGTGKVMIKIRLLSSAEEH